MRAARLLASVSRLHIVAIAALGALTFGWAFTGERPWAIGAVVALDWFLVNLINRAVDLEEDRTNGILGTGFVVRHRRVLVGAAFATLAASLAILHAVLPALTPWRVAYHALGLAYNYPLLPGRRRIKQLYFFKNCASATGFLLTVFAYPLAAAGWSPGAPGVTAATIAITAVFFFLFELSYEVIYDLRDVPGDRAAGARTYPVVHGPRVAAVLVVSLVLAGAAALAGGYAAGIVPWRLFVMIAAPAIQLVLFGRFLARGVTAGDCIALTWIGAGLLATYHLWVAAGLPGVDL